MRLILYTNDVVYIYLTFQLGFSYFSKVQKNNFVEVDLDWIFQWEFFRLTVKQLDIRSALLVLCCTNETISKPEVDCRNGGYSETLRIRKGHNLSAICDASTFHSQIVILRIGHGTRTHYSDSISFRRHYPVLGVIITWNIRFGWMDGRVGIFTNFLGDHDFIITWLRWNTFRTQKQPGKSSTYPSSSSITSSIFVIIVIRCQFVRERQVA